jgi:hypothetical protein
MPGSAGRRTETWKGSRDPDFTAKMARILDLYDNPPADGRVICVGGTTESSARST